jgi:hypothetical protein
MQFELQTEPLAHRRDRHMVDFIECCRSIQLA